MTGGDRAATTQAKAMSTRARAKQMPPGVLHVAALAPQTGQQPEIMESSTNGRFVGRCKYFLGLRSVGFEHENVPF